MPEFDVLVEVFDGVVGTVEILSHTAATEKWTKWAKEHGYSSYEEFLKALEQGVKEELRWFEGVELQISENEIVHRSLTLRMKGKLQDINSYCGAVGGLANDYDVEIDPI